MKIKIYTRIFILFVLISFPIHANAQEAPNMMKVCEGISYNRPYCNCLKVEMLKETPLAEAEEGFGVLVRYGLQEEVTQEELAKMTSISQKFTDLIKNKACGEFEVNVNAIPPRAVYEGSEAGKRRAERITSILSLKETYLHYKRNCKDLVDTTPLDDSFQRYKNIITDTETEFKGLPKYDKDLVTRIVKENRDLLNFQTEASKKTGKDMLNLSEEESLKKICEGIVHSSAMLFDKVIDKFSK